MNNHVTVLEIDAKALLHNFTFFKQKLQPKTKILAVVKAESYGGSSVTIAKYLEDKVDYFAVAYATEGIALRNANIKTPILVLHPQIQNLQVIIKYSLEPNLYSFGILKAFIVLSEKLSLQSYPVHFKFNTGLNRLGFLYDDVPKIVEIINNTKSVYVASVFSHLAASEDLKEQEFTNHQINKFNEICNLFLKELAYQPIKHILNTSGVINYTSAQLDMVRLGIGLYGFGNDDYQTSQLKNTHNLRSVISQIHIIKSGETVGYNRAYKATDIIKTATIPIGHADGLSRKLGNKQGYVFINNQKAFIIGNVCMDMIMVDVTSISCNEGDEVIIFNSQQTIKHVASVSETIVYEVLTSLSNRICKIIKY